MSTSSSRVKVALLCPGLGLVNRGYETFTRECFDVLATDPRLDARLFKGAGPTTDREQPVWMLRRTGKTAERIGRALKQNSYYVEQISFAAALLPHLRRFRPDVLFFSDVNLRTPLHRWRKLTRQSYRLLLSNGGPVGPPFPRCDHVHQVLPDAVDQARAVDGPDLPQTFVPYGFDIKPEFTALPDADRMTLRTRLGLPTDRPILLGVGALNRTYKRMDYVIREVASLPEPRPYLLLLGSTDHESPEVIQLGRDLLGDGFRATTVNREAMPDFYQAADAFVLGSLSEGFGRVYVEALAQGLPSLAHDYAASRYCLGEHGSFADFRQPGALTQLVARLDPRNDSPEQRGQRHQSAYDRFSWSRLRDDYVAMILRCASEPIR